ncbi:MAG: alkaline phosphatase family protein [Deltaproteobacteria bacterium]|nr:alkaline phosphatase family protein [Deltaproteobacteria bacterium]
MRRSLKGSRYVATASPYLLWLVILLAVMPGCRQSPSPASEEPEQPGQLLPQVKSPPVLLIGADGLDRKLLRKLVRRGNLPNFERLLQEGASGVLYSEREIRSPALWTTIATGRPRAVHGIYDFVTGSRLWPRELRGEERRLVTSKMRKVPAIWNMASAEGRKVAVVGWLNTWPAEKVNGVMVSPYVAIGRAKQITIKGAVYPDTPYQVWPQERWPQIRALITTPDEVEESLVQSFGHEPDAEVVREIPLLARYLDGLRWSLAHTLTMRDITLHLLREDRPDLTMVYFEGADSLGHRFWLFRRSQRRIAAQLEEAGMPGRHAGALAEAFGHVVDRYYELLDGVVGELLGALPENAMVLVVSDHGFGNRSCIYPLPASTPFTGEHRIEGTVLLHGNGIRSGASIYGATIYDVTPSLIEMLGLTAPSLLEGKSMLAPLVEEEGAGDEEERASEEGEESSAEESFRAAELERLRSLGYIQ